MSMTRQEQLDAVVRNYGEWPTGSFDRAFWRKEAECVDFFDSRAHGSSYRPYGQLTAYAFTRSEVEARKGELQNKPSWDDAPYWAEALGQDSNGDWHWLPHYDRSDRDHEEWLTDNSRFCNHWIAGKGEVIGDWRDTLEKRPAVDDQQGLDEERAFLECVAECLDKEGAVKWNGEGLPPVGVECTIQLAFNDMGKCKITYMGDGVFCYRQLSSGEEYTGSISDTIFRPIKSDREKWVEMVEQKTGLYVARSTLEAIYDAGLAKIPE